MKRDLRRSRSIWDFSYRRMSYNVKHHNRDDPYVVLNTEYNKKRGGSLFNAKGWFTAYVFLRTEDLDLDLNIENPISYRGESCIDFLNSKNIAEIQEFSHCGFTWAEWECLTTEKLVLNGLVTLGMDYAHGGDEQAVHTLETVCEDCEIVIDKIHEMGLFKGTTGERDGRL